jgi:hypothetical protein
MFRPLQKNFFLTDKILKKILQKSLLPCEKHIKAVCLARLQAREFGVATCVLKIFSKIFFLDFYN